MTGGGTLAAAAALALGAAGLVASARLPDEGERAPGIYGFHRDSLALQREIEAVLLQLPDPARIERHARILTEEPHVAGAPENDEVARYISERFKEAGLATELKSYRIYMGYVNQALLEQVHPEPKVLSNPEEGIRDDKDSFDRRAALSWNAYSPSALTRRVVYVHHARPEDFATHEGLGVPVKDRVLLARYFKGYRGRKAREAKRRGAAGIIFYSDPAEDGYVQGDVSPDGPRGRTATSREARRFTTSSSRATRSPQAGLPSRERGGSGLRSPRSCPGSPPSRSPGATRW